jgi:tetratricopeptide (TPR) repeat protein
MGSALLRLGRFGQAREHLQHELQANPQHRPALAELGNSWLASGQASKAGQCFEQLVELDPKQPDAWHNLGVCWFLQRDFGRGIPCFQKSLDLRPDYLAALFKLIYGHAQVGHWGEVRQLLRKAESLAPQDAQLERLRSRLRWVRWRQFWGWLIRPWKRSAGRR